jgi:hypothetical protein
VTVIGYINDIRTYTKDLDREYTPTQTKNSQNSTVPKYSRRIMKRINYMRRATQRFLSGTKYRSPVEAVEAGVRSLTDWAEMLAEEREFETEANRDASKRARTGLVAAG